MSDTDPDRGGSTAPVPEFSARTALVVWVGMDAAGGLEGVVERVRTGEKERFHGLTSLTQVIARMAGGRS